MVVTMEMAGIMATGAIITIRIQGGIAETTHTTTGIIPTIRLHSSNSNNSSRKTRNRVKKPGKGFSERINAPV
jgi:hypothetical protein